jgi:type IV pilus assembly protein PilF
MAYSRRAYAQAKEYLIRLEKVSPANPEVLWLAVRVERRLGDRDAAASYSTQLTRNFPQSKEARALQAGIEE